MPTPSVWAEVRCDLMLSRECNESGPMGWIHGAMGLKGLTKDAKEMGWKIINGETVCPECAALQEGKE